MTKLKFKPQLLKNSFKAVFIILSFITMFASCDKDDDSEPYQSDDDLYEYSIGDTIVSTFTDEQTGEILSSSVYEFINIGTENDPVPYLAIKKYNDDNTTRMYNSITVEEVNRFISQMSQIDSENPGRKLAEYAEKYNCSMQTLVAGYIESELDITNYFSLLDKVLLYMDNIDKNDTEIEKFIDFIFLTDLDIDDAITILNNNGYTIDDLLMKMDSVNVSFDNLQNIYSYLTDKISEEGFTEFVIDFIGGDTKEIKTVLSDQTVKGSGQDALVAFVGDVAQRILNDAGSSFDANSYSDYFHAVAGNNLNWAGYYDGLYDEDNVTWKSGSNYDHIKISADCNYNLHTSSQAGDYISNAQIGFTNISIGSYHHVSTEISSSCLNAGTADTPVAEIRTKVAIKLIVKCIFSHTYTDDYMVVFSGKSGVIKFSHS